MIKKITVEFDGKNYTVPNEITVTHYGEIMRRFSFAEYDEEKAYDIISVLLGVPFTVLRDYNPEKLFELSEYLQEMVLQTDIPFTNKFKFKGIEYGGILLPKMTFGEYIDLSNYIKDEASIYTYIHKICALLYRPVVNGKVTPYNVDEHEIQSEIFKDLPVKYFFGAFKNLFTYFYQMKKEFTLLFGDEEDKRTTDLEDDKLEDKSNLPWYKMVMLLASDDFTKIDYVTGRPMIECFNHLTYIKIKQEEDRQRMQKQQNQNMLL